MSSNYNYAAHGSYYSPSDKSHHRAPVTSPAPSVTSWGTIESNRSAKPAYPYGSQTILGAPLLQTVPLPNVSPYPQPASLPGHTQIHPALTSGMTSLDFINCLPASQVDLSYKATNPPVEYLIIVPENLPESWTVRVHQPGGITIGTLLQQICQQFCYGVQPGEFSLLPAAQVQHVMRRAGGKNVSRRDFLPSSVCSVQVSLSSPREGAMCLKLYLRESRFKN